MLSPISHVQGSKCSYFVPDDTNVILRCLTDVVGFFFFLHFGLIFSIKKGPYNSKYCF
jgi:hypothetical protein